MVDIKHVSSRSSLRVRMAELSGYARSSKQMFQPRQQIRRTFADRVLSVLGALNEAGEDAQLVAGLCRMRLR